MNELEEFALSQEEQSQIEGNLPPIAETPITDEGTEAPPKPESPPVQDQKTVDQKMVPLAALHEARQEQRELKARLQEYEQKLATVDQLKQDMLSLREKKEEIKPPDPNEDPLGYTHFQIQEQKTKIAEFENWKRQQTELYETQRKQQEIITHVASNEQEFAKTNNDYWDAASFLKDVRTKELAIYGITDPQMVSREIAQNTFALSQYAMQKGKNPAEIAYNLAKQYGYKAKTIDNTLQTIEQGQKEASKSLSSGGKTEGNLTAESLLELNDSEFDAAWDKLFKR